MNKKFNVIVLLMLALALQATAAASDTGRSERPVVTVPPLPQSPTAAPAPTVAH